LRTRLIVDQQVYPDAAWPSVSDCKEPVADAAAKSPSNFWEADVRLSSLLG
jgi:hypothetical protein